MSLIIAKAKDQAKQRAQRASLPGKTRATDGTNVWFTADMHLGHANIIRYSHRPFTTVAQMDEYLIAEWNKVVGNDHIVYHVGDFTLGTRSAALQYLERLNGVIRIIPGSHDAWIPENVTWMANRYEILPALCEVEIGGRLVVMCHYAMESWPLSHYGSVHVYGHHHGRMKDGNKRRMDVGVDPNNFRPVHCNEVFTKLDARPFGHDS